MSDADSSDSEPLLLFVCTGNICRSPMAEAIARDFARRGSLAVRTASAGMAALDGHGANDNARAAVAAIGLDLDAHRARQLTRELVEGAALVVAATRWQRDDLRHFFRAHARKIVDFDELTGLGDLRDPYGAGQAAFDDVARQLQLGMPDVFAALRDGAQG